MDSEQTVAMEAMLNILRILETLPRSQALIVLQYITSVTDKRVE